MFIRKAHNLEMHILQSENINYYQEKRE